MKRMRSFAKRPRLDKQAKPKSANVKKNTPSRFWKPAISLVMFWKKNPQMTANSRISDTRHQYQCVQYVRATPIDAM